MKKLFIPLLAVFFVLTGVDMHVCAAPNALSAAITRKAAQARTDIQTQRPAAPLHRINLTLFTGFPLSTIKILNDTTTQKKYGRCLLVF